MRWYLESTDRSTVGRGGVRLTIVQDKEEHIYVADWHTDDRR